MKQTRNALGMLLKAYRAIFAHAWKCGLAACALGAGLATAGIASADVVIDTTGTISITDEDQDKYVGETITINGDDKNFLENQAENAQVGTVKFAAQPILSSNGFIPTSYVKNEGGTLKINKLITDEKATLATEEIKSAIGTLLTGNDEALGEAISDALAAVAGTQLAVGNLEFRNSRYSGNQAFLIEDATLNKYSILRVHKSSDYQDKADQNTKVEFDNLTMNNITGVAFGVGLYADSENNKLNLSTTQVTCPDEIIIKNLNVNHGGTDIDYAALLSSDNTTVKVGTINIDDNTLDLAGSTISIVGNDVKEYLNDNYKGNDTVKKVIDFLDHYADEADFRLQQGKLDDKALEFLKGHTGKLAELLGNKSLQDTLDRWLGKLGPSIIDTTLTGVTLQALDGSDTVTVNMTMKDPAAYDSTRGPRIVLGNVKSNVVINFDKSALDAEGYQDGETAVFVKGDVDEGKTFNLRYTDGVENESAVEDTLKTLAGKLEVFKQPNAYAAGVTDENQQIVNAYGSEEAYKEFQSNFDPTKGSTVTVSAHGLMDGYSANIINQDDSATTGSGYGIGKIYVSEENQAVQALQDVYTMTALMWRNELLDMNTRLGEIRDSGAANGVWVRPYGGNFEYSDRDMEADFYGIQLGYDRNVGNGFIVGGALNYTQSDLDYDHGTGDGYAFGASLYATYLFDSGFYLDTVAKFAVMHNDSDLNFTVGDTSYSGSADYHSTAVGVSMEAGWKFDIYDVGFIEPQVQVAFGHMNSDDFSVDNYSVDTDSVNTILGRAGFRAGLNYPDGWGSVYLTASAVHDFAGDVDSHMFFSDGSDEDELQISDDLEDTWYEFGIGTTVKFADSFYMYGNFKTADGGDVDMPWYVSVGARYTF